MPLRHQSQERGILGARLFLKTQCWNLPDLGLCVPGTQVKLSAHIHIYI